MSRLPPRDDPAAVRQDTIDSDTLRRAVALVRVLRDPALPGLVFLLSLILIGATALTVTVFQVANAGFVPLQSPHVVSGGFSGVALMTIGCLLAAVHAERRDRALAISEMQHRVDAVTALVRTATHPRHARHEMDR